MFARAFFDNGGTVVTSRKTFIHSKVGNSLALLLYNSILDITFRFGPWHHSTFVTHGYEQFDQRRNDFLYCLTTYKYM